MKINKIPKIVIILFVKYDALSSFVDSNISLFIFFYAKRKFDIANYYKHWFNFRFKSWENL